MYVVYVYVRLETKIKNGLLKKYDKDSLVIPEDSDPSQYEELKFLFS